MAQVHTAGRLATHMQPSFQLLPVPLSLVQAVYHMPTSEDADPASSMPLALQSVFYKASAEPFNCARWVLALFCRDAPPASPRPLLACAFSVVIYSAKVCCSSCSCNSRQARSQPRTSPARLGGTPQTPSSSTMCRFVVAQEFLL